MIKIEGADKSFESCQDCVHAYDSTEICILRRCIHAFSELRECYKPKKELKPSAQPEKVDTPTVDTPNCEDAVSRQAVIDALIKADYEFTGILSEPRARRFEQTINALPSAQPENEKRTAETAQNVSDSDLISRKVAIDAFWSLDVEIRPSAIDAILNMLKNVPSAQPEPSMEECACCVLSTMTYPQVDGITPSVI